MQVWVWREKIPSGQALLTDGSGALTFGDVDSLPTQSGSAGKFLKTDGTENQQLLLLMQTN